MTIEEALLLFITGKQHTVQTTPVSVPYNLPLTNNIKICLKLKNYPVISESVHVVQTTK